MGQNILLLVGDTTVGDNVKVNTSNNLVIQPFYVAAGGNDSNDGSEAAPFLTLEKAYARAAKSASRKTVAVASDISLTAAVTLAAAAVAGGQVGVVTITSDSTVRTLARTDSGNDSVIKVNGGAKVVFQNITIDGKTSGSNRALSVRDAGTEVTLETGATLTGKATGDGGALAVAGGAVFNMKSGEISGSSSSGAAGGGVAVVGSVFNMSGGKISDNSAAGSTNSWGGGVFVSTNGTFNMSGGEISGNTASGATNNLGGGVYIYQGTFNITHGKISGNNASNGKSIYNNGGTVTGVTLVSDKLENDINK
jgi:hypothetical protein